MAAGKKGSKLCQHLGQGIFQHIMPCFRKIMALRRGKTSAPLGIEMIIKAEVPTAPTYEYRLIREQIKGFLHPAEAVPGGMISL